MYVSDNYIKEGTLWRQENNLPTLEIKTRQYSIETSRSNEQLYILHLNINLGKFVYFLL